jgi:hypothetical protein
MYVVSGVISKILVFRGLKTRGKIPVDKVSVSFIMSSVVLSTYYTYVSIRLDHT